ncbi:c-type cytochrome biogenesis protein CcmI [Thioclava sp. F1Mire-8]|uniref:c-type cytochrome biogenesis protein CcmI n=1 Tax=Thioclava sp. F1Mire-8 TaxID=1973006 RepID=UPI000B53977C|nr:c-type cytochrome biogenesis protein CcmI [Thioclava sp. F1Mire-8]OWY01656.1 c-type cytochrome biogenesis protein CcmI [Thioclava sp. F1Mire-8]
MLFWIIAAALVAVIALLFALALLRGRGEDEMAPAASYDVQVYRDQLRDLERDVERGVTSREEADRAKLEISRRMLEADRKAQAGSDLGRAPKGPTIALVIGGVVIFGAAFWLYTRMGAEGYQDQPIAQRFADADKLYDSRPSQAEAEKMQKARATPPANPDPKFLELMKKLREAVAKKPDDPKGLELLARNEAALGNFDAAWKAQQRLVATKGDAATAQDYAELGEMMAVAAGGLITPEAEKVFATALKMDQNNGLALYYVGLMMAQNGRGDRAFRLWDNLLRNSESSDPWVPLVQQNIEELAWLAGEKDYTPPRPRGAPGPSQADVAAAADMSPEARQQMIRSMVERLNDRLAQEGGSADDWARLISSLRMIGEVDRADAVYGEAKGKFGSRPDDMAKIDAAHQAPAGQALQDMGGAQAGQSAPQAAPALPGPSAQQMKDAASMTPEERQQMIQGMVDGLFDRLTTEGGTPQEWARVISSLATLGQTDRAKEAWGEAQKALADEPDALAQVEAAAKSAGVAQ